MATRRTSTRHLAVAVAGCVLVAASSAGVTGAPAERSRTQPDRPWSGFRIDANDRASGSWLGARKLGASPGRVVYRIDPDANPQADGFGPLRRVTTLAGARRTVGARTTARAAWILSKYGTYAYEIQSAAVDVAVLHLLAGRRQALRGRAAAVRLSQTGQASQIKAFATEMLRDSQRLSGPYRLVVRQAGEAALGDQVQVVAQIAVARSGRPLPSVPVSFRIANGPWLQAGETDEAGRVAFDYVGGVAGPHRVTARVARVPEHRLLVMQPRRPQASRVVVAGRKHVVAAPTTAIVKARPAARVVSASITSGNRTSGTVRVSGAYATAPTSATVVLRGPFGSPGQATCERKALRVRHVPVAGNGHYPLPRVEVRTAGFYVWQVVVPGNIYNLDAATCDGGFRVRPRD